MYAITDHFACSEVHRTAQGAVNTAQIQNQFTVDIKPEVIVAGKFKDNVVSPFVHTIRSLCKYGGKFHAEIIISIPVRNRVQRLALTRIRVRKLFSSNIALVCN